MGKQDSSKTRVAPVFDALMENDPTGISWVDSVVALGSRREVVATVRKGQRLVSSHARRWGTDEVKLVAPQALLEYLLTHIDPKQVQASSDTGEAIAKRSELANQNETTIAEALAALRSGRRGRSWFVLEGESRPDAIIETEELIVCVEGKRTEACCTTHTTWMRRRSQLIRHMDAAREAFPKKRILGLLIVEGGSSAEAVAPSPHWLNECANQYAWSMIEDSLPHRSDVVRRELADGVLGVTTWQAICSGLGLPWPPARDVI